MHFLRTLFWVIIAVALLIFAAQNNGAVTVNLWGGLQADVKLWLLVIGPFLLGFLPTWIFHRISLWQQQRHAGTAARLAAERGFVGEPGTGVPGGGLPSYTTQTSITPDGVMQSHPTHPQVSPTL